MYDNYRPLSREIGNFNIYNRTISQSITELLNQCNCTWYLDFRNNEGFGELKLVDITGNKQNDEKAASFWSGKTKKLFYPKFNTNLYSKTTGDNIKMQTVDFKETRIRIEELSTHDSALVLGEPIKYQCLFRLRRGWTKKEEELIWERGKLLSVAFRLQNNLGENVTLENADKNTKIQRALWLMEKAHNYMSQDEDTLSALGGMASFYTLGPLSKSYLDESYKVTVNLDDFPWLEPYCTQEERDTGIVDLNTPQKSWLAVSRVGRLFVLDELGEYSYDPTSSEPESDKQSYLGLTDDYTDVNKPYDFTQVFSHVNWTPRYRPFLKKLLTAEENSRDVRILFNIKVGDSWDTLIPIKRQFKILKDKAGIYFTGKLGAFGDMTAPDAEVISTDDKYIFDPDNPFWYVIVEAVVESDLRVAYHQAKDSTNKRIFNIVYHDVSKQQYYLNLEMQGLPQLEEAPATVNPWDSNTVPKEDYDYAVLRDDYEKMQKFIELNPELFKLQKTIRFTLPGFVTEYNIGDVIDKIEGRNYNINQVIVGLTWDFENMQTEVTLRQSGFTNLR